jgi:hypothetical protein
MTTTPTAPVARPETPDVSPETLAVARSEVKKLFEQSDSFRALPLDVRADIARNTALIAATLAEPERAQATDPYAEVMARGETGTGRGPGEFRAGAAREGAAVAGALLQQVNFPTFVASLVQGVFHAIVESSIEQMEAYGRLVADVAKSLNQFRDENVSANQGRDHLTDTFPDIFAIDVDTGEEGAQPRVRVRDGVDEDAALQRINSSLPVEGGPVRSLDDETIEESLVPAARTQLATSRQQLLATMVLMGINRIIVRDGRITAKVLYDFQARDNMRYASSATSFDYGDQYRYASQGDYESEVEGGERSYKYESGKGESTRRDGSYYAKGTYKNTAEPVLKLVSAYQEQGESVLQTRASLAGQVDINFASDFLPLEKMADSFQIAQIQTAAQPGQRPGAAPAPGATQPAAQQPAAQAPATQPPAAR